MVQISNFQARFTGMEFHSPCIRYRYKVLHGIHADGACPVGPQSHNGFFVAHVRVRLMGVTGFIRLSPTKMVPSFGQTKKSSEQYKSLTQKDSGVNMTQSLFRRVLKNENFHVENGLYNPGLPYLLCYIYLVSLKFLFLSYRCRS